MQSRKYWAFLALGAASLVNRASLAAETPHAEECPGASAWIVEHPTASESPHSQGDGRSAILEPALLENLKLRVERDQTARKRWLVDQGNSELASAVMRLIRRMLPGFETLSRLRAFRPRRRLGSKAFTSHGFSCSTLTKIQNSKTTCCRHWSDDFRQVNSPRMI
jgi:hypothetical protein